MDIDWFTVIAQVINFLILVWLLKRFLYKPVLEAIDKREARIAAQLTDAGEKKAEALKEQEFYKQKNELFDRERAAQLEKVAADAKEERQKQFEKVRNDSEALQLKLEKSLKEDQQKITGAIRKKIQDEVFSIAGKTLSDLGSASLDEQIVSVFIQKIKDMDEEGKKRLEELFDTSDNTVFVKTAFEMAPSLRTELENTVNPIAKKKSLFKYVLQDDIVSGIELSVKNYKLSWNIGNYLDGLQKHVEESFANPN